MKHLKKSWRLIAVFVLVAVLSLSYVKRTRAFTLIDRQLLPAVQLVADQSAAIKITNTSASSIGVICTVVRDNGSTIIQKTETVSPGMTFTQMVKAGAAGPLSFHTLISLDTAHAAVSDVMVFDKTTGQAIAILPFVEFDTN